jgi:hypothetical protein
MVRRSASLNTSSRLVIGQHSSMDECLGLSPADILLCAVRSTLADKASGVIQLDLCSTEFQTDRNSGTP